MVEIVCTAHRIMCTAVATSPVTIRMQVMPLYGPQEWFDCELETLVISPNTSRTNEPSTSRS